MGQRPEHVVSGQPTGREIVSETLPGAVLRDLRDRLISGELAPGDRVSVDALAKELGVSAIPIREALRVLLSEGRVEYAPHRGFRVTALSFHEIEEIFLICSLLETEALRRGVARIDDEGIDHMRQLLERLESAVGDDSERAWLMAVHQDFHFVPMEYAGLPRLVGQLRQFWDHTDHYRTLYFLGDAKLRKKMDKEHRKIFDACASRDVELVVELMDSHRAHVLERMGQQVGKSAQPAVRPSRNRPEMV